MGELLIVDFLILIEIRSIRFRLNNRQSRN